MTLKMISSSLLRGGLVKVRLIKIAKLRIVINSSNGRYLLGILEGPSRIEYLPIIIDLKKNMHGKNLGFNARRETVVAIENALEGVIDDYLNHTKEAPTMIVLSI